MRLTSFGATVPHFSGQPAPITAPHKHQPRFGADAASSSEGGDRLDRTGSAADSDDMPPVSPADENDDKDKPASKESRSWKRGLGYGFGSMAASGVAGIALCLTPIAPVGVVLLLTSPVIGIGLGFWQGLKKK